MKKILLAGSALALLSGAAAAADLPSRMAPPVYTPPPVPVFTWTGGYFGINAGYAFDNEGRFRTTETGLLTTDQKVSTNGFTGGGQIGYNFQIPGFGGFGGPGSGIVFGVEADAAYMDTKKNATYDYTGVAAPASLYGTTTTYRSGLDYLGTVRGRVGYAFGQFLVYGTGGFAYGGTDNRIAVALPGGTAFGSSDKTATGYAYGGGVEYALPTSSFLNFFKSSAVTIKAEYLHYDLGKTNIAFSNPAIGVTGSTRVSNEGDLVRAGINYKF